MNLTELYDAPLHHPYVTAKAVSLGFTPVMVLRWKNVGLRSNYTSLGQYLAQDDDWLLYTTNFGERCLQLTQRMRAIFVTAGGENWKGCGLVNPLCPEDFCALDPQSHERDYHTGGRMHVLGTDHQSEPHLWAYEEHRLPDWTRLAYIIEAGDVLSHKLFPEYHR